MGVATAIFGLGIGLAMTAAYTAAASVIPHGRARRRLWRPDERLARGPCDQPGRVGLPRRRRDDALVFVVDAVMMAGLALAVRRKMADPPKPSTGRDAE